MVDSWISTVLWYTDIIAVIHYSDRTSSPEGQQKDVLMLQPHAMPNAAELISAAVTFCYPERQELEVFLNVQPPTPGG